MKKSCLLLILFVTIAVIAIAQKNNTPFFVDVSGGIFLPVGKFANKDVSDPKSGLAKMGAIANISAGYMLNSHFGVMLLLEGSSNKQSAKVIDAAIRNANKNSIVQTNIVTNYWETWRIMPGGVFETLLTSSRKIYFRSAITAGICKSRIPQFSYAYVAGSQSGSIVEARSQTVGGRELPWTFCYQGSVGLKFKLADALFLCADAGYFNASPVIQYPYTLVAVFPVSNNAPGTPTYSPGVNIPASERKVGLGAVNATVGVEIRL